MKSFRFYLTEKPERPLRMVDDYSPEELARFVQDFREGRRRCLGGQRLALGMVACGATVAVGGFVVTLVSGNETALGWSYLLGILFMIAGMVVVAALHTVRCPACRNELMLAGEYCPHCGAKSLGPAGWRTERCCSACGKAHQGQAATVWDFRYCSVCGVTIGEEHAPES